MTSTSAFRSASVAASEGECKAALMKLETRKNKAIPKAYEAMPLEVKMNEEVIKKAMEKCYDRYIPKLFEAMPVEVQKQEDFIKKALEKCYDNKIPDLFAAMPAEVKMQEEVIKKAMDKCDDWKITELFNLMPTQWKMNATVAKKAIEKSDADFIPKLFAAMPDELKKQEVVFKALLEKCYGSRIPRVFEVMPFDVQVKGDDVKDALGGCDAYCIPALFEVMPTQWKMNADVARKAIEKCEIYRIPELFAAMPADVKTQEYFFKMFVRKCPDERIPDLFKTIPAPAKPNTMTFEPQWQKEYVLIAVDVMDALNNKALQDFQTSLSDNLQDDEEVKSAFERKKVNQLPFFQKYKKLLRAALEVSVMYILLLGPIEGALWLQRNTGGKIAKLSNQHWKNKTDFAQVHFEIFDGCMLSAAPQPFDITLPLTSLKLVVITAAFGFIKRDLMTVHNKREQRWKAWICVGVIVYSVIMIPISFISLVVHYVQEVNPHIPGGFKKYECLYAIMNLAPFQTNYLMYLFQFLAGCIVSESAGIDTDRVWEDTLIRLFQCKLPRVPKEALAQPLLHDDDTTIGQLQLLKVRGKFMLFFLTLAPYLCVEIPFIITHKIPAAGCFFPFVLFILVVTCCIFAIVNRNLLRILRMGGNFEESIVTWLKTVEEAGYMPIVPALWGLLVVNEFLTLAPIYWYGGAGWFDSGMMVLVERSTWIYMKVFGTKIMTKFWSAASFINEIS